MEQALSKIGENGLAGALLVLSLLAIIWLNNRMQAVTDARLTDTREALMIMAKNNEVMASLKDAVAGLTTTLAGLATTVQTMHADSKSALELTRTRDDRVERMIEENGKVIRDVENAFHDVAKDISRLAGTLNQGGR